MHIQFFGNIKSIPTEIIKWSEKCDMVKKDTSLKARKLSGVLYLHKNTIIFHCKGGCKSINHLFNILLLMYKKQKFIKEKCENFQI